MQKKNQQQKNERNQLKTALKTIEIVTRYIQKVTLYVTFKKLLL